MTAILGILQFISIILTVVYEYNRKSSALFLWLTLTIMFGLTHMITTFVGSSYSDDVLCKASLFVIAFCLLYLITRKIGKRNRAKNGPLDSVDSDKMFFSYCERKTYRHLISLLFIITIIMIVSSAHAQGGLWNTSWGGSRAVGATQSYFNNSQILTALYYSLSGLPFVLFVRKENRLGVFSVIMFSAEVIVSRNRVMILPIFVSLIAYVLYHYKSKLNLKVVLIGSIGAVVVIYVIYALRAFRWMGSLGNALTKFSWRSLNTQIRQFLEDGSGEIDLRNWFYFFIKYNNNFHDFGQMHTYIRMLLIYIPTRFSFGLKPDDFAIAMGSAIGMASGGSMHSTLFGDCYANAGYFGIFLGVFWGVFANLGDKIVSKITIIDYKRLAYCVFGVAYVVMGRGAVYNGFVYIAWGMPIIWIYSRVGFGRNTVNKKIVFTFRSKQVL